MKLTPDGDTRKTNEEGEEDVGGKVENGEDNQLQAELVLPAEDVTARWRHGVEVHGGDDGQQRRGPLANFSNILWAAFEPTFFLQKI